jgi:DNA repair protein SbcC/Rad50
MRLHSLQVDAFGPFAAHEQVDFDTLTGSGLFLVCGPTGAGKTSVLDTVCFALFGQVPGERDKARRLHSDHARPGSGPRVVLEATVRGRRLRITRSPEWMRPKKRGTGEVREHAKALVEERVDGEWLTRTTRIDEAGDLIGSLLGLTMSQFCQVALLPQGQFETFLRCGAQERHALLERLFGTHRFRAVEEWLAEHRRGLAARSDGHADRVSGILERVAETAGEGRPDEPDPDAAQEWSAGVRTRTETALGEATQARAEADQHAKDARAALDEARDLAELQARHRDASRRDADLRALAESTERMSTQVDDARRAAGVHPLLEMHAASGRRAEGAAAALDAARAALPADVHDRHGDVDAAAAAARHEHERGTRLEVLLPVQRQAESVEAELGRVDTRLAELDAERQRLDAETRDRDDAREQTRRRHTAASSAGVRVEPLRERVTRAEQVARAAGEVPGLLRRREALAETRAQAADTAQQAREAWLDLRQARLDGIAAELARGLADDRPCPVCGSAEHPAPAVDEAEPLSPDAEQHAEEAWQHAEQRRLDRAEELAECDRELAARQAAADGADPGTSQARLREAGAELAEAEESAARAETLAAELARLESAAEETHARSRRLDADRVRLAERRARLAEQHRDLRAQLESSAQPGTSLDAQLEQARERARLWEALLEALREHSAAVEARDAAGGRLEAAVTDAGFGDVATAREAVMSPGDLSNTEALLQSRADQAAQVRAVLDDPRVAEAAARPAADLAALAAAVDHADRCRDEAVVRERALAERAQRLDELHEDLRAAVDAWAPARSELAVAERMAALCAGTSADNRHKMRLSAYVLAARLEQVVAAANERLLRMSSGRYTLRHSVARGVGDRRGGLGLQVHDGWTGDLRDPATLSGGETFYTSLALALGLADVVTHEAGGTEIDTLFVDEGFGSLDPDTLDEVMDVLDQLRSGGRTVGLVSHVSDLRARVPAQVHVHKTRAGSTLSTREHPSTP